MTDLKTLKDISIQYKKNMADCVKDTAKWMEFDIKAEAIKWVKALDLEKDKWNYCLHHVEWIKNFFNLTEEDLQ